MEGQKIHWKKAFWASLEGYLTGVCLVNAGEAFVFVPLEFERSQGFGSENNSTFPSVIAEVTATKGVNRAAYSRVCLIPSWP